MSKFENIKKLFVEQGNQMDIFNNKLFDILVLLEKLDDDTIDYCDLDDNQIAILNNCESYIKGEITLDTLKYKLFGITPKKSDKISDRVNSLEVRDLLTQPRVLHKNDDIMVEIYRRDGTLVDSYPTYGKAAIELNVPIRALVYAVANNSIVNTLYKVRLRSKLKL